MQNVMSKHARKVEGIILLGIILAIICCFLFLTPVSPLGADLRAEPSAVKVPAEGFWGTLGFYEKPADNNNTYFLMLLFFSLAIYKTVCTCFLTLKKGKR